jgi:hypothetical protein
LAACYIDYTIRTWFNAHALLGLDMRIKNSNDINLIVRKFYMSFHDKKGDSSSKKGCSRYEIRNSLGRLSKDGGGYQNRTDDLLNAIQTL